MERSKINAKVKLSDAQFDALEQSTRRALISQLFFIVTGKYEYCWGAQGDFWTIVRYDKIDASTIDKDSAKIVDKWR